MKRQFVSRLFGVGLLGLAVAASGCSKGGEGNAPSGTSKTDGQQKGQVQDIKPMTIRIVTNSQNAKFPDGMDIERNPYMDYIRQNTNLDVKVTLPPVDGYDEKLNAIMASGDLPDLLTSGNASWFVNYVNQKALMPLNELIDKYGPDLKKNIPQEAWEQVTIDGNIYAVPSLNEASGNGIVYARKDWLDRLGLQPPKTLDEYYNVMKAFVERDPDGNNKNDTLGFSLKERLSGAEVFFGAFGTQIYNNNWYVRDGKLVNGSILPETKDALAYLAKLYQDKLLDQEFPLNKTALFNEKVANGKIGLFVGSWTETRGSIETNRQNDPKAEWIRLDYPTGPNGKKGVAKGSIVRFFGVVPVTSKNAEGVIRLLNFVAGKGYQDLKHGFENEIWTRKDGIMTVNFEEHNKHFYRGIYSNLADIADPQVTKDRLDGLGIQFHLNDNLKHVTSNLIKNEYLGVPTPAMGKFNANLIKLQEEAFTKIIAGASPLSEFDTFVARWKKEGGDAITKEVNEWYAGKTNK